MFCSTQIRTYDWHKTILVIGLQCQWQYLFICNKHILCLFFFLGTPNTIKNNGLYQSIMNFQYNISYSRFKPKIQYIRNFGNSTILICTLFVFRNPFLKKKIFYYLHTHTHQLINISCRQIHKYIATIENLISPLLIYFILFHFCRFNWRQKFPNIYTNRTIHIHLTPPFKNLI